MEKVLGCFYKIILKNTCESKTSQPCLHALINFKRACRPVREHVFQLFYNICYDPLEIKFVLYCIHSRYS